MIDIRQMIEVSSQAALEAGKSIMEVYRSGEFLTTIKSDDSPLTTADKSAQKIIIAYLSKTNLPVLSEEGINIAYNKRKSWEYFWLIDPLDGTKEFIHKNGEFTVNIALIHRVKPIAGVVYAPSLDTLYFGSKETGVFKKEKGKFIQFSPLPEKRLFSVLSKSEQLRVVSSRSHPSPEVTNFIKQLKKVSLVSLGSSLKFMLLLENRADIYPRLGTTMEWDTTAAHAILNASNRGVYQMDLQSELIYNKPVLENPFFIAF
jgi:3'(2'), 5'-bisphosphate nucleotidase